MHIEPDLIVGAIVFVLVLGAAYLGWRSGVSMGSEAGFIEAVDELNEYYTRNKVFTQDELKDVMQEVEDIKVVLNRHGVVIESLNRGKYEH